MKIYRKRYIPNELVDISGDEVLHRDDKTLVTKWIPIRPRDDIGAGMSCVYFDLGYKISKFFDKDGNFKFWYCDIIDYKYDEEKDEYTIIDLLIDVVVYSDGHYEVLDEDELEDALEKGIINQNIRNEAIQKKEKLINDIQTGKFNEYIKFDELL